METFRFDGRVAIITGAGRGLGRAYAAFLVARGAKVAVNDVGVGLGGGAGDDSVAETTAREISGSGTDILADSSDVASPLAASRLVEKTMARFGRIDIVINNAGILRWRNFPDTDLEDLTAHFSVHVAGAFNVTRAAWPHLVDRKYGRVLLTTSSSMYGLPSTMAYGVAKAATVGLANSLAVAGKPHGIVVNTISPSAATRMVPVEHFELTDAQIFALAPERVVPLAGLLVHERHIDSGRIYCGGGGRVARVFMAETLGYKNPEMTIENLSQHWDSVNDMTDFFIPTSTEDPRLRPT